MALVSRTVRVPAKINLRLKVGRRRQDGYHELLTVYMGVCLYETIRAQPIETSKNLVRFLPGSTVERSDLPKDSVNLAYRALDCLATAVRDARPLEIAIDKRIPVAAGLAGGSADAAGTLLAANALWGGGLSLAKLRELAAVLGSDVAFLLEGGLALGTDRGQRMSELSVRSLSFYWVLVFLPERLPTPEVYAVYDQICPEPADLGNLEPGFLQALTGRADDLAVWLENDLAPAARSLSPTLDAAYRELSRQPGVVAAIVCGSGPSLALLAEDEDGSKMLAERLGANGWLARPVWGPVWTRSLGSEAGESDILGP